MARVFTCVLKEPHAGMSRGTTIQVTSNLCSPDASQIVLNAVPLLRKFCTKCGQKV